MLHFIIFITSFVAATSAAACFALSDTMEECLDALEDFSDFLVWDEEMLDTEVSNTDFASGQDVLSLRLPRWEFSAFLFTIVVNACHVSFILQISGSGLISR